MPDHVADAGAPSAAQATTPTSPTTPQQQPLQASPTTPPSVDSCMNMHRQLKRHLNLAIDSVTSDIKAAKDRLQALGDADDDSAQATAHAVEEQLAVLHLKLQRLHRDLQDGGAQFGTAAAMSFDSDELVALVHAHPAAKQALRQDMATDLAGTFDLDKYMETVEEECVGVHAQNKLAGLWHSAIKAVVIPDGRKGDVAHVLPTADANREMASRCQKEFLGMDPQPTANPGVKYDLHKACSSMAKTMKPSFLAANRDSNAPLFEKSTMKCAYHFDATTHSKGGNSQCMHASVKNNTELCFSDAYALAALNGIQDPSRVMDVLHIEADKSGDRDLETNAVRTVLPPTFAAM
jgi:hypothetical protein